MSLLFISYLFNGDYNKMQIWFFMVGILAMIPHIASGIDLKTGIDASKRLGLFKTTSFGLRRTVRKDIEYLTYFFLMFLLDCCLNFFIDIPILCIICTIAETIIEVISIRENLCKGQINNHDPIALMQTIATAYGDDKAQRIFDIIKDKTNESKSTTDQ